MKSLLLAGVLLLALSQCAQGELENGKAALPLAAQIKPKTPGQIFLETEEVRVRNPKLVAAHSHNEQKTPQAMFAAQNLPPFLQSILSNGFFGGSPFMQQRQPQDALSVAEPPRRIISVLLLRRKPEDGAQPQAMPSLSFLSQILPQLLSNDLVDGDLDHEHHLRQHLIGGDDLDMNFAQRQRHAMGEHQRKFDLEAGVAQARHCMMASLMRLRHSAYYRSAVHLLILSALCFCVLLACMVCGRVCKRRRMLHASHNGMLVSTIDLDQADKKQAKMLSESGSHTSLLFVHAPPSYERVERQRRHSQAETRSLPAYEEAIPQEQQKLQA